MKTLSLLLTLVFALLLAPSVQAKSKNERSSVSNTQFVSAYEINAKTPKSKVARFQRENGLRIDGIVGPQTHAYVKAVTSKEVPKRAIFVRSPRNSRNTAASAASRRQRLQSNAASVQTAKKVQVNKEVKSPGIFTRLVDGLKPAFNFRPRPTIYWEPTETRRGGSRVAMHSRSGKVLAYVSPSDKREAEMEGSLRLRDGRVLNILNYKTFRAGKKKYRQSTWFVSSGTHGRYTSGLRPFRDLAVDPRVVPPYSMVWIAELKGVPLPDKTVHDGWCRAVDIGKKIKGARIDIFIGPKIFRNYLAQFGIRHLKPLNALIVRPHKTTRVAAR
jgi:3D (Asp-Asp-Asp) domain-containing protein